MLHVSEGVHVNSKVGRSRQDINEIASASGVEEGTGQKTEADGGFLETEPVSAVPGPGRDARRLRPSTPALAFAVTSVLQAPWACTAIFSLSPPVYPTMLGRPCILEAHACRPVFGGSSDHSSQIFAAARGSSYNLKSTDSAGCFVLICRSSIPVLLVNLVVSSLLLCGCGDCLSAYWRRVGITSRWCASEDLILHL